MFIALFGCSSKIVQTSSRENAPYWVQECSVSSEWYCGFGASNAEAMSKMAEQISVKINSEQSRKIEQTKIQRAGEGKSETVSQKSKQEIKISTGDVEVAGTQFYMQQNGTVHAAVKRADLADFYSYKIKTFLNFADIEFERAEAGTEKGNAKLALSKINAIKDTLENNLDSWTSILHIAGGSGSEAVSMKKRELLLLADGLRNHLQDEVANDLRRRVESGELVLYLDVSSEKGYADFDEQLREQLRKDGGYSITKDKKSADYIVTVKTSPIRCEKCKENVMGLKNIVFCYAKANGVVNSLSFEKEKDIHINEEEKGGFQDCDEYKATGMALRELKESFAGKIINSIKQGGAK
jgi:hypothetical protein